jgi:hypothetical protein
MACPREMMLSAIQTEYGRLPEVVEEESAWLGSAERRRHDTETELEMNLRSNMLTSLAIPNKNRYWDVGERWLWS